MSDIMKSDPNKCVPLLLIKSAKKVFFFSFLFFLRCGEPSRNRFIPKEKQVGGLDERDMRLIFCKQRLPITTYF